MSKKYLFLFFYFVILFFININISFSQETYNDFPTLREQAIIQEEWVKFRLENILLKIMRENNTKMWIVITREHNEDPVFTSLVSPTTLYARRRTIFAFFDPGTDKKIECYSIISGTQNGLYIPYADTTIKADRDIKQWFSLKKLIEDKQPETISVNISKTSEFSEGLLASEWEMIKEYLGNDIVKKIIPKERIPLDYISTRIPEMIPSYKKLYKISRDIISNAFSGKVIKPGITTTSDVEWWMRQESLKRGFQNWFQTSVDIQRPNLKKGEYDEIIMRGDVLHCDFGIKGMNLNTDIQHLAYVLKENETDAPDCIKKALLNSNRLQDILLENMKIGLTGNQILKKSLDQMKKEGIKGSIYAHPIGEHGHGAGAIIGLYDRQDGVPGKGDVPLLPNTWYSIELQANTKIPEWNNFELTTAQEEDAMINKEGKIEWVQDRQTKFILIK